MMKKIRILEADFFSSFSTITALLGADFPPPRGFIWILLAILCLTWLQDRYLCYLQPRIAKKEQFLKNNIYFLLVGIGLATSFILLNPQKITFSAVLIWYGIIIVLSVLYGICFWMINKILFHKIS